MTHEIYNVAYNGYLFKFYDEKDRYVRYYFVIDVSTLTLHYYDVQDKTFQRTLGLFRFADCQIFYTDNCPLTFSIICAIDSPVYQYQRRPWYLKAGCRDERSVWIYMLKMTLRDIGSLGLGLVIRSRLWQSSINCAKCSLWQPAYEGIVKYAKSSTNRVKSTL